MAERPPSPMLRRLIIATGIFVILMASFVALIAFDPHRHIAAQGPVGFGFNLSRAKLLWMVIVTPILAFVAFRLSAGFIDNRS
jgi:hypothetical protein